MGGDGGRGEFEAFFRDRTPRLLHVAWLLTGDRGHAEDAVQTALANVAVHWSRLGPAPDAYARRAVVNACADRHRRRRRSVTETPMNEDQAADGSDGLSVVHLRAALLQGLRALPERQRTVLVLRYVLDLTEAETADTLGVGAGTVKSSVSRGLARMRELAPGLSLAPEQKESPA